MQPHRKLATPGREQSGLCQRALEGYTFDKAHLLDQIRFDRSNRRLSVLLVCIRSIVLLLLLLSFVLPTTVVRAMPAAHPHTLTPVTTGPGKAEWSPARIVVAPNGEPFLGTYERSAVTLTIADLPAHGEVTLTFDFYAIDTWDGNAGDEIGPDIFNVTHSGDQTLLNTTFSNYPGEHDQAYPGSYPGASNPGQAGASAVGVLGYGLDAVYALNFTFAHTASLLQVQFSASGLQGDGDERWGLDNVVVKVDDQVVYAFDATTAPTDTVVEVAQFLADDGQAYDRLGDAVAIHDEWLAVGAPVTLLGESVLGLNKNPGAVYLFAHNPAGVYQWEQVQKLTAADGAPQDHFGWKVALDADLLVVSAPWAEIGGNLNQGALYFFAPSATDPNRWEQIQKVTVADGTAEDQLGQALARHGSLLLAGAREKAYLFGRDNDGHWTQIKKLVASDGQAGAYFGNSVALAGDVALVGASEAKIGTTNGQGAAYLFLRDHGGANNWGEFKKLTAADGSFYTAFGASVILADNQALISGPGKRQVYVFNRNASGALDTWAEVQRLTSMDGQANYDFGSNLAYNERRLVVSSGWRNQAELFERAYGDAAWRPLRKIKGSTGAGIGFGGLALRDHRLFVGSPDTSSTDLYDRGAVYLFDITGPAAPRYRFSQTGYSVQESVGTAAIPLILERPSPYPLTIDYATVSIQHEAMPIDDYTPVSGTLRIPTGATEGVIQVPITNDDRLEMRERFELMLGKSPGGLLADQGAYTSITIDDDDSVATCDYLANDEAALDRAIRCLYLAEPGVYTIQVTGDITLTRPLPLLTSPNPVDVIIEGNGHIIDAQGHGRVLNLYMRKVAIRDLTLRGGRLPQVEDWQNPNDGGGIYASAPWNGFATAPSCALTLTNVILTDNEAYNGGGLYYGCEEPLTMNNTTVSNNRAVYGGAFSTSGGEEFFTEAFVQGSTFSGNTATIAGGAFDLGIGDGGIILHLVNSTVSGNQASERGGGLFLDQASHDGRSEAQLINSTIADNAAPAGSGVYNEYGILRLSNSIIAANQGGSSCVLIVSTEEGSGQISSAGYNLDSDGTCLPEGVRQSSDLPNGNANLGPLADNGGATLTHALLEGSQALDAAANTVCLTAPVSGVDQRGVRRPQGARCDIGAFEVESSSPALRYLFVSSHSSAKAGEIKFRDEDIIAYDFTTPSWQMVFDGSDVGITKDVDAFTFRLDGSLLLSFNAPTNVPGLGNVDDSDIVQFTPTQLGNDTAGSFALYLRGADVGLTTDGEDIDAIGFSPDGYLIVSTIGDFNTPTLAGKDEDLIQLNDPASGAWSLFLDGSAVGLANEDVNGFWLDPTTGERYLTVKDSFAFTDGDEVVQVDADDIFVCTPTPAGGCTYRLFWDSDLHDYGSENIDSFHLGPLPARFVASVQAGEAASPTPDELGADDDSDDFNVEELTNQQFVPWVVK